MEREMEKVIEVSQLRKSYGKIEALKGIDFYVERGKLFAFLGPNGAGKSTTLDILCTFLQPDGGEVRINQNILGRDDEKIRGDIGVVFQDNMLDALLSVEENLKTRGRFYGFSEAALRSRVDEIVQLLNMRDILKRRYGKLSGGQRRKCDIARALINAPSILFLDEPTTGLDPKTRKVIWETVRDIQRKNNMTVFLTTHYMEEAAEADYVIVINEGRLVARGTPSALREQYSSDRLRLSAKELPALKEILQEMGLSFSVRADEVSIALDSTMEALPILDRCRHLLTSFELYKGSMDDAFISIIGEELPS